MTRLLNASAMFLRVVREFGYPDCTMKMLATDEFYQKVVRGCLSVEVPEKFLNEVIEFIKSYDWP